MMDNIARTADVIARSWPNGRGVRKDDSSVLALDLAKEGLIAITPQEAQELLGGTIPSPRAALRKLMAAAPTLARAIAGDSVEYVVEVKAGGAWVPLFDDPNWPDFVDDLDEACAYVEELSRRRDLQYRLVARLVASPTKR